jgi:REP element-mobilizing transposase RayT
VTSPHGGLYAMPSLCGSEWFREEARFRRAALLARGYFVSTVGRDEAVIREYIKKQEQEDKRLEQMNLWR